MSSPFPHPSPVQTSEPPPAPMPVVEHITKHGLTIFRSSPTTKKGVPRKFQTRIRFKGTVHWLTLAETAKESFEQAVRARRAIHEGRWDAIKDQVAMRATASTTVGQVFTAYRLFNGLDRPAETTREQNINALSAILREVLGATTDVETLSLLRLSSDLVWRWKELKRQLAGQAGDDERATQILRSANSRLRQARSLFSENDDLRKFYQHHNLVLPDNLVAFCKEPPFADCDKQEYHAPTDQVVAATFAALERLVGPPQDFIGPVVPRPDDLNMYLAIWLAIGFGLRRGEISRAKVGWFENVNGVVFCRGNELAKNKKFPEVRVQFGAWAHLAGHLHGKAKDDYVLAGSATERQDICFRSISEWMRSLGWQTTHHLHEFRAWAGCQIAMAPGNSLREAQVFMRHASFGTTEKYYGHHLKIRLNEVQFSLPTIAKTFTPVVLDGPAAPAAGQAG